MPAPESRIVGHNGIQWDIIMFPGYGPTGSSPNVPSGRGRAATLWGLLADEHETDEYETRVFCYRPPRWEFLVNRSRLRSCIQKGPAVLFTGLILWFGYPHHVRNTVQMAAGFSQRHCRLAYLGNQILSGGCCCFLFSIDSHIRFIGLPACLAIRRSERA